MDKELFPSIYEYAEPANYLQDVLHYKQKKNPLFSVRAWSQQMGFGAHSSLVFFLRGKRKIRPEHLDKINKGLRLSAEEEKYLRILVQLNCASKSERAEYESRLKLLRPTEKESLLDSERFRLVSDWVHMAILEMTKLKDFCSDPVWMAKRLAISVREVSDAVERLVLLGLLQREGDSLVKTNERLTTPKDRASECIRDYHRQVIAKAVRSIDEQTVQERVLNSCSMTIDSSRMEEAKELILKFRSDMSKLMEKESGDETYQLNVQFFKLTKTLEREV